MTILVYRFGIIGGGGGGGGEEEEEEGISIT